MQIRLATGFDTYTNPLKVASSVSTVAGSATIGAYGRNSTSGLRLTGDSLGFGANIVRVAYTIPGAALSTIYVARSFKINVLPPAGQNRIIMEIRDTGTTQCALRLMSDGTIQAVRGTASTFLGTIPDFVVEVNVAYHFCWKTVIADSGGSITLRVNNSEKTALTGLDTKSTSNTTANEVVLCNVGSGSQGEVSNIDTDDLIVADDWISNWRVREDLPTGIFGAVDDGISTGAADSAAACNEANPDDNTTKTALQNVGNKILFTFAEIPAGVSIKAVIPNAYAQLSAAGAGSFKPLFKIGGVEYQGSEFNPSTGAYAYFADPTMVSPETSSEFTPTEVNAMGLGLERIS